MVLYIVFEDKTSITSYYLAQNRNLNLCRVTLTSRRYQHTGTLLINWRDLKLKELTFSFIFREGIPRSHL